ncbi:hypothetical protein ACJX0J_018435, partial [Zea mays]
FICEFCDSMQRKCQIQRILYDIDSIKMIVLFGFLFLCLLYYFVVHEGNALLWNAIWILPVVEIFGMMQHRIKIC